MSSAQSRDTAGVAEPSATESILSPITKLECVISGTYRKDLEGLKLAYQELEDLGCKILSPSGVNAVQEKDGFVYMRGEETELPDVIETRHLEAIQRSQFVWLHAPDGYVGPTAALEVGFARASGVPVFSQTFLNEKILSSFVRIVRSPTEAVTSIESEPAVIPPAVQTFQYYYKRVAIQRGYYKEDAQNCLLLMVEEVGELAKALRVRKKLARHGSPITASEALELADVFLYVIHMANILNLDLATVVKEKELINLKRFIDTKVNIR
jgi:NTP pyrophosphatase (non-canonical NTP hydrolase)